MKRLRSSDDLNSNGEKSVVKDWGRREDEQRSSSSFHRNSYHRASDSGRKVVSSSTSRYDRLEDDRESLKPIRKRVDYDLESFDRRKGYDRRRDGNGRGILSSSTRMDQINRSTSFSEPRRDFPKGFRSKRESWRRLGSGKDGNDGSWGRGTRMESKDVEKSKSPLRFKDVKSPVWSKDSESERSKSVEGKRYEDLQVDSDDREEGELEPDPQPSTVVIVEDKVEKEKEVAEDNVEKGEEEAEGRVSKDVEDDRSKLVDCEDTSLQGREVNDTNVEKVDGGNQMEGEDTSLQGREVNDTNVEKVDGGNQMEGDSLEEDADAVCNEKLSSVQEPGVTEVDSMGIEASVDIVAAKTISSSVKDKGKSVAEVNLEENKSMELADIEIEGPSTRGFQFLSTDPIKKAAKIEQLSLNKPKDDKFALELSLSLPNVLLPIGQAPGSPSHGRSIQSIASSDGFTASMSFSGSQHFTHNPSCSFTHTALDLERSVGSKPLFQGVDWKALADENKSRQSKENVLHQQTHLSKDKKQKDISVLQRNSGTDLVVGADFAESVVTMIVSEPLQTMARRFNDMSVNHVSCVKEFTLDIVSNSSKKWQLSALQKALQKRSDITLDMLLNANRIQLEILVALKTGLVEYLTHKYDIPSSDLAEIFLNLKCKNLNCRTLLPVDECDCKICSQWSDFCRECMCLVCSKFDTASNTCSWVGCDVCLHWCHADCGLRESHIRNGCSASGVMEMQFYCVACDHPSEMFGFIKEVFHNFLKEWTPENLSRELKYVGRIFRASEDVRGKKLYDVAVRMLSKLGSTADLQQVQNQIMDFFTETNSIESKKELPASKNKEACNGVAGSSQGAINSMHEFDSNRTINYTMDLPPKNAKKEGVFDELESIVRIKQAEAKMFRARAEEAQKESEALKRIAVSKSERNEEEYRSRIVRLRLVEAEEMRKQKVEELEGVERGYEEYLNMKMRMEREMKELLLKIEAGRRNLST